MKNNGTGTMEHNNNKYINNTMKDIIEKTRKELEEEINKIIEPYRKRINLLFTIMFIIAINLKYINTPKLLTYNERKIK